jgi:hypothetical protein
MICDPRDTVMVTARRSCWLWYCFVRGGGSLREPIQRVDTTLGWLQRGEDTVARPDSRLAGSGHMCGFGVVVVVV